MPIAALNQHETLQDIRDGEQKAKTLEWVVSSPPPTPWTVRECHVVFKDLRGFTHTIRVHTSSLMRAAAQALKELEEGDLLEGCDLVGEAQVEIVTRTVHTIHISKVKDWLRSGGSPKEIASKRDLLPRAKPPTR